MPGWVHDLIATVIGSTILFGYMIALAAWDNRSCHRKQDDAPGEKKKKSLLRRW